VKSDMTQQLSILACVTGLLLVAVFFVAAWLGAPNPEWLPMVIAAIAGFEMFMLIDALRRKRAGDGSNG
jgi:Flp pilus assembly protein TadB